MNPITLKEHEKSSVPLPEAAVRELEALKVVKVLAGSGNVWRVEAQRRVGCVRVGGVEVRIQPKLHVRRLLHLAGYGRYGGTLSYRWFDDAEVDLDV